MKKLWTVLLMGLLVLSACSNHHSEGKNEASKQDSNKQNQSHKKVKKDGKTYIDGILMVNKQIKLPKDYNPGENPKAVKALNKMIADAKKITSIYTKLVASEAIKLKFNYSIIIKLEMVKKQLINTALNQVIQNIKLVYHSMWVHRGLIKTYTAVLVKPKKVNGLNAMQMNMALLLDTVKAKKMKQAINMSHGIYAI